MNRHRSTTLRLGPASLVLALVLGACGDDAPSRADVVGAITDERVPGLYRYLSIAANELTQAASAFCAGDRADAAGVLDQAADVRFRWAALRPFWFGPVMERRSQGLIDYPATPADVIELADSDTELTVTSLRDLVGADQRGLGAIEVLSVPDGAVPVDDRACAYMIATAELVAEETSALAAAWEEYGPTLSVDDAAANAALADIVSETLFGLVLTGSDNPKAAGQLAGARWAMLGAVSENATGDANGDDAEGLTPLLDDDVIAQLTQDFDALSAAPSFDTEMAVEQTIKTNVVGDLGITVKFSDADGDG